MLAPEFFEHDHRNEVECLSERCPGIQRLSSMRRDWDARAGPIQRSGSPGDHVTERNARQR